MKAAFPAAPDPIQRISTLQSLIHLMLHICWYSQTHTTPALATMNVLFCAVSPGLYSFFMNKTYPSSYFPFPKEVDAVPDFSTCTSNNKRTSLEWKQRTPATKKPRANIITITMNIPSRTFSLQTFQKRFTRRKSQSTTEHGIPTHAPLINCEIRKYYNRRLWSKSAENGCKLASHRWLQTPGHIPLHWHILCKRGTLPDERPWCHWHWPACH